MPIAFVRSDCIAVCDNNDVLSQYHSSSRRKRTKTPVDDDDFGREQEQISCYCFCQLLFRSYQSRESGDPIPIPPLPIFSYSDYRILIPITSYDQVIHTALVELDFSILLFFPRSLRFAENMNDDDVVVCGCYCSS